MIEAYPLNWPSGYPRSKEQKRSQFKNTLAGARDNVYAEIKRLKATEPIISSNIPLKQNGEMYADWQRYKINDFGVAVYFTLNGSRVCLCCDTYNAIWENLHAIARTISAMRQIERDGVSDFLNRAFTGFTALPAPGGNNWFDVLGVKPSASEEEVKMAYRNLAKQHHPDKHGGNADEFHKILNAYTNYQNIGK